MHTPRPFVRMLLAALSLGAWADHPDAGHSNHGVAFNEGPRQAAYLMDDMGDIDFAITSNSKLARAFFLQGLGQLHGFWYFEAERSFRQVAALDSACAMAYWGMAVANRDNEARARGFLRQALNRREGITDREKAYIEAFAACLGIPTESEELAKIEGMKDFKPKRNEKDRRGDYVKKLEDLVLEYPDDIEAKALLVVQLWLNVRKGHPMNSTLAADALAQQVLDKNPMHPAHHYRIHLWDQRRAKTTLESAAACGFAAPGIAHMWHMPGHIYSKLQRFGDAAWHQEASARVDHAHMMRDRVLPDQIHNFAHNNEWLCRNLMNLGRVHDAIDLAQNMSELPRHPTWNTLKKGSAKYGRHRLYSILTTFELWDRALELAETPYLEPSDIDAEKLRHLRLLGRAAYATGDSAGGDAIFTEVETLQADISKTADDEWAEKKKDEKDEKKKNEKRKPNGDEKQATTILTELRLAKALAAGQSKEALAEKDLKTNGVDNNLLLAMHVAAKDFEKALELSASEIKKHKNQVQPLARHVHILDAAGKAEEARKAFGDLRALSQDIDLDMPVFARLAPIAKRFSLPRDWRQKRPTPDDIRKRPKLADLGPIRWRPSKAERWTLPDHEGKELSLAKLNKDENVLVIFYLGAGCLHCVQQLDAFVPKVKDFAKAGIRIVGISVEDVDSLKESLTTYSDEGGLESFVKTFSKDGAFPFPLLSDESLSVFKQWRAYDDFEKMPLHGTFLVDRRGYVRWQDISYEPFTKTDFLLKECKRLLAQPDDKVYEQIGLIRRLQFWR